MGQIPPTRPARSRDRFVRESYVCRSAVKRSTNDLGDVLWWGLMFTVFGLLVS